MHRIVLANARAIGFGEPEARVNSLPANYQITVKGTGAVSATVSGMFGASMRMHIATIFPRVSGTFVTLAGQAPLATETVRVDTNNSIRAMTSSAAGQIVSVIDCAATVETRNDTVNLTNVAPNLNGGVWMVLFGGASAVGLTADGVHPTTHGHCLVAGLLPTTRALFA